MLLQRQEALPEVVLCGWLQIMYQVFSGQKPPLDRTGMPEAYGQLIDDCWQDDPEQRPTFAAILQHLRGMYKDERQRLHNLQVRFHCGLQCPCRSEVCMSLQGPVHRTSTGSTAHHFETLTPAIETRPQYVTSAACESCRRQGSAARSPH